MVTINKLRTHYWVIDPGYLNLKQATKTVFAILISLWLLGDEELLTKIIAATVSGVAMQGVLGKTVLERVVQVVIFDSAYFFALALGFFVHHSSQGTAIVLVILGFVVNYIRRFGLNNSMVPMDIWILCFLATVFPVPERLQIGVLAYGTGVGLFVSAVVVIFCFPDNYPRLFVNNANRFFNHLANGLKEMRRYVLIGNESVNFGSLPFVLVKERLDQLLESNLSIQQNSGFSAVQKQINHILMHQLALMNAYSLMIDVFHSLYISRHQLSRATVFALSEMCKELSHLFSTTRVSRDYMVSADHAMMSLPNLADRLGKMSLSDPTLIMTLLNFKLGFDLLNQNEKKLLRGVDET